MIYNFDNKECGNELRDLLFFGPVTSCGYLENESKATIPLINSDELLDRSMFHLKKFYSAEYFSSLTDKYGKDYILKHYVKEIKNIVYI